jgi:6-phosphogluconolactonase (cycloisomerase 2 family)
MKPCRDHRVFAVAAVLAALLGAACGGSEDAAGPGSRPDPNDRPVLYVAHGSGRDRAGRLSAYEIDPASGALSTIAGSPVTLGTVAPPGRAETANPQALAAHPKRPFVYVPAAFGGLWGARLDSQSGALSLMLDAPFVTGEPAFAAVESSGRFLYTADPALEVIRGLAIDATTGLLQANRNLDVRSADLNNASNVAATPDGRYLYATSAPDGNGVFLWAFTIDSQSGALGSLLKLRLDEGNVVDLVIHPNGRVLYTLHPGRIRAFAIDAAGALTPVAGSPFPAAGPFLHMALAPSGRHAYVASGGDNSLATYAVDATSGALSPQGAAIPTRGERPWAVVVEPRGRFVYVANSRSDTIAVWRVDAATGSLTPALENPLATASGPSALAIGEALAH